MYGLCDAPLLWQLPLRYHFRFHMNAIESRYDDCFYMFNDYKGQPTGEATVHVDDNNFSGTQPNLDHRRKQIEERFGTVTRQTLPFQHVGLSYTRLTDKRGYYIHQRAFCLAL